MKAICRFAAASMAAFALTSGLAARAATFVKDVMLIGGTKSEVNALRSAYEPQGWTVVEYDLNKGASGDYIYLLYKGVDVPGGNGCYGLVTGFYIKSGSSGVNDSLSYDGRTYYLTPYDGGAHFEGQKGDLNSNAGGAAIHLYYTKDAFSSERGVNSISFDETQSGAVGENGGSTGYDLNKGCGENTPYIYMHYSTGAASTTVNLSAIAMDYTAANGTTLTGTLSSSYKVSVAAGASVTLSGATIPARSGLTAPGITCLGDATITIAGSNAVTGSGDAGIYVLAGKALTITGTGSLAATGGGNSAGIGSKAGVACGSITLAGGTVTATRGGSAANSIGPGQSGSSCGTVKIGDVTTGPVAQSPIAYSSTDTTTYTANFNANGGTGSTASIQSRPNTPRQIPANGFSRDGYTFARWNSAANGSGATYDVGQWVILKNTTIYAQWSYITYSISYNLAGGSGTPGPASYNVETATFTLVNPTRDYYTFTGWTGSNGTTPQTTVTVAKGSTGNKTYTANWTPTSYTISYNLDNGDLPSGKSNPTSYTVASPAITLVNPVRDGYTFAGWTGVNGRTPQLTITIPTGSAGNRAYTANWTPINYSIGYDLAGGALPGGSSNPVTYNANSAAITLVNPVRDGYTFAGWTGSNGNSLQSTVTIASGSWGNKSYTANWTPASAAFNFNANGGTGEMPAMQFTTGAAQCIPSNSFVRAGFVFSGWNASSDGTGAAYDVGQVVELVTGPLTLYAQWAPALFSLTSATGDVTLLDGQILEGTGGANTRVVVAAGATVTLSNATLTAASGGWAGITCMGDATLVIVGENAVSSGGAGHAGIETGPSGTTLAIRGGGHLDASSVSGHAIGGSGGIAIEDGLAVTVAGAESPAPYSGRIAACAEAAVVIGRCEHAGGTLGESGGKLCEFCGMPKKWAVGAGTAESPWQLATTEDWNELAAAVGEGFATEGRFFRMTADIGNVTTVVGSSSKEFRGVFDGGGHTLGVAIEDTVNQGTAPFRYISGATISNLTVTGAVVGSTHAAGLVGLTPGTATNLISDCTVDVAVSVPATSGNRHMGGVVGHGGHSALTIRDTVFSGTMSSTGSYAGGLQGWSDGNTLTISNCLFSGAYAGGGSFHPVAIHCAGCTTAASAADVYYSAAPTLEDTSFIAADGTKVFLSVPNSAICRYGSVRGVDYYRPVLVEVSGILDEYEYLDGEPVDVQYAVSFEGSAATEGVQYSSAIARYGVPVSSVAGRGSYELVVTGNAAQGLFGSVTVPFRVEGLDQGADGAYLIASAGDFAELSQLVADGFETAGRTFRLAADVSGATATVGTSDRPFAGVFDGAGRTLGVSISDPDNEGAAPFRNIAGATISNLVVSGSVSGGPYSAGLVGFARSGENLVLGCVVNVAVSVPARSGESRHVAGVVGHGCSSRLVIRDSVCGGTLYNQGISAGGFVASCENGMVLSVSNCVFTGRFTGSSSLEYFHPIATKGKLRSLTATFVDAFRAEWAAPTIANAWYLIPDIPDLVVSTEPPANGVYRVVSTPAGEYYYTCEVSGVSPGYPVSAIPVTPSPVVTGSRGALVEGTDYDVSYANNAAEGVSTVTVTGKGEYRGSQTIEFTIGDTVEVGGGTTEIGGEMLFKVTQDVTLGERLVVVGAARLLLCDGATLTAPKGITVADGNSLEILAESDGENTGALVATAEGRNDAGIGGTEESPDSGQITIRGGRVTASCCPTSVNVYSYGAGIGGGKRGCAKVLIEGGVVTARGSHGAAIGEGSDVSYKNNVIRITGGTVTATVDGYGYAAGIGHGGWYSAGSSNETLIEITGGTVNASGCAGIGGAGGGSPNIAPHVRITGGVVTASGWRGYAIGAGGDNHAAGTIELLGGQVVANGAIGGSYRITPNTWYVSDLTISLGADDFVTAGSFVVNTITLDGEYRLEREGQPDVVATPDNIREGGTVRLLAGGVCVVSFLDYDGTAEFSSVGVPSGNVIAPIGLAPMRTGFVFSGWTKDGVPYDFSTPVGESFSLVASYSPAPALSYLDGSGATVTTDAYRTILPQDDALVLEGGVYALGEDVTTDRRVTVSADTVLVLRNGTVFTANNGVEMHPDASLEICGQEVGEGETAGALVATANEGYHPGIGYMSPHAAGKGIAIRGGVVTATGSGQAAGIGGGYNWEFPVAPDIVISGGTVTATGGNQGAGIGSGLSGNGGSITISGGVVTATGGSQSGSGIGGGGYADGGTIVISGGIVTATGNFHGAGIGGSESACSSITISGGTVTAKGGTGGSAGIGCSSYNSGDARDGGTIAITGGKVTVLTSNGTYGIGGSTPGGSTAILLDWTDPESDFIDCPVYNGTVSIQGSFKLDGTVPPIAATVDNIAGHKIVPVFSFSGCVPGSGTESDPYRIGTVKQWNAFAIAGTNGLDTAGRRFVLEADLSVSSRFAGVFQGTFDGGGHKLTVSYAGSGYYVAPFATISNATIRSLAVAGTISGGMHCSGLAGYTSGGANLVEDCEVSAAIATSESHCGGFIGHAGGFYGPVTDILRGCVFSGSIAGGHSVGTVVGWSDDQCVNELYDCFDRSDSTHPIGRGSGTVSVSNSYYTAAVKETGGNRSWPAASSGRRVCALSVGEGVEADFGASGAAYGTSGVSVFAEGVVHRGVRYCVVGSEFEVIATGEKGRHHVCVVTDGAGNDISSTVLDGTTFTMPEVDAAIARVTLDPAEVALSSSTGAVELYAGDTLTGKGGSGTHVVIADGATVTFCDVDLSETAGGWAGVTCLGDATVILEGDSVVKSGDASHPAVQAGPAGTTLAIQGSGSLSAAGGTAAISIPAGGELSLADGLMVTAVGSATPAAYADRVGACAETAVVIEPCGHGGGVFDDERGVTHCEFCGTVLFLMDGGSGAEDDPWIVRTTKAWDRLAIGVESGFVTNGCFFRLDADIAVTNVIGSQDHPFTGVFDGGGHTLTADLNSSDSFVAPFSVVSGVVISNLVAAGTVNGGMHCSGLVGSAAGTNLVENCLVSAVVSPSGTHCGGMLGHGNRSATTIAGCVFTGRISGTSLTAGTFWGWSDAGAEATLVDCLDVSSVYHPVGRGDTASLRVENVYYTYSSKSNGGSRAWDSNKRGKHAYTVRGDDGVTVNFGAPAASYGASMLAAYAPGLAYNGIFYAGGGEVLSLSLSSSSGLGSPEFEVEYGSLVRNGGSWTLTMPETYVVIKERPQERYEVVLETVEHADPDYKIRVDGTWSDANVAVSNAQVTAVYYTSGPAWTIESFTVVAADGTTVPCTTEQWYIGGTAVNFRMPGMAVTVTPTVVATSCTEMSLGVNEIAAAGVFTFVAPTNGVYSFTLGNTDYWYYDAVDEMGMPMMNWSGDQVTLVGGQTYYFLLDGDGAGTTMTVAKTGDVEAYPVEVVPAEHGTVVASASEAPEGCFVYFTVTPDPGWRIYDAHATDADDNDLALNFSMDGSSCFIEMPASAVTFEAEFERDYTLVVGVNQILFTDNMPDCTFIAPSDGLYRFRSTCGGYPGVYVYNSNGYQIAYEDSEATGDFDCVVEMEAGAMYYISVEFFGGYPVSVEATIAVSKCAVHSVSVDGDVLHGSVDAVDEYGDSVVEAMEGSRVRLEADPSQGYELGGWNVVDESGASVEVLWDGNDDFWYFRMPGTNVLVSASFGRPHSVTAMSSGPVYFDDLCVNGNWSGGQDAAPGAKIEVAYWVCPGWDRSTFSVVDEAGANVPHVVKLYDDEPNWAYVVFTMPNADVYVSPVLSRADCPALAIGANAIDAAGTWNFVAPEDGVYSFAFGDTSEWYGELYDDWGWEIDYTYNQDVFNVQLVKGEVCHLYMECSYGASPNEVTVTKEDGVVVTHTVAFDVEHCTVVTNAVSLPSGRVFAFELYPEPGFEVDEVVAEDADGTSISLDFWAGQYSLDMPDSDVTIMVTLTVPLPRYLEDAADDVLDNYYAWAAKYGPDPLGTNEVAFLLNLDPATPVPDGAVPLKVVDFRLTSTNLHVKIASDYGPLTQPEGMEGLPFIGNGVFGMQAALDLSGDEWRSSIMPVVTDGQGNVVIDMPIPSPDMMPPSFFMRPFIRASDPSMEIDIGEIEIAIP